MGGMSSALAVLHKEVIHCTRCPRLVAYREVVALGKIGFDAYLAYLKRNEFVERTSAYKFAHAASYLMPNGVVLLASYHPSNQNTATGKLTAKMFEAVFREAKRLAAVES